MSTAPYEGRPRWAFIVQAEDRASTYIRQDRFLFRSDATRFASELEAQGFWRIKIIPIAARKERPQRAHLEVAI